VSAVHVAVGVVYNADGEICVAKRPDGKHLAGLWEFPGGKVEPDEDVFQALKRELHEELSIRIDGAEKLIDITFEYPEKTVLLDVCIVRSFQGVAQGREGQEVRWVAQSALTDLTFPEANEPIIRAIQRGC